MTDTVQNTVSVNRYTPSGHFETSLDGYSPAPLLLVGPEADDYVRDRQSKLGNKLTEMAFDEVSKLAKKDVAHFAARSVRSRMQQREGLNSVAYMFRENSTPDLSILPDIANEEAILESCERAKFGGASPIQAHLARRAFGMNSIELANLTTFGPTRRELYAPAWADIEDLIARRNGSEPQQEYHRFEILEFDRDVTTSQHIGAVRIGTKRNISQLEDGSQIKVRTTAILNTRPDSEFDKSLTKELIKTGRNAIEAKGRPTVPPEFQQVVARLLETGSDLVLARSDTIYETAASRELRSAEPL